MTEKQVQYFLGVYKHGNISKAAEELIVARPVISRALSAIEKEIGVKLFDRKSSGIMPTEHGVLLYNMLDNFAKSYAFTVEKLRNPGLLNTSRNLRIGMLDASSGWFYPMVYHPFHEKYPDIIVNVEGIQAEEAANLVLKCELDMAVAPIMKDNTMLFGAMYLYTTQWVLCSPKGSAEVRVTEITAAASSQLSMAILETLPPPFYEYKNIVLTTKDPKMVQIAVAGGYAHAVVPMEICANWDDVLIRPFVPPETPHIYMLWNDGIPHSPAFDQFIAFVRGLDFEPLRTAWGGYNRQTAIPV